MSRPCFLMTAAAPVHTGQRIHISALQLEKSKSHIWIYTFKLSNKMFQIGWKTFNLVEN